MSTITIDDVFNKRITLPNREADERLSRLVGIDDAIKKLSYLLDMLLFPGRFEEWRRANHPDASLIFNYVKNRHPLIILAGDVGTGKTELSETIGSRVARNGKLDITLFPMSLSSRGSGLVGEMTNLISSAFTTINNECEKIAKTKEGNYKSGVILLIDEADALAQSREEGQMHHEDRAGVNALIRGIDLLNRRRLPVAILMCTNRIQAMDPAIMRRAADVIIFERPNQTKRSALLRPALSEIGFTQEQIEKVVEITGKTKERDYGFTFSDITQRLFHAVIMSAYPDKPVDFDTAVSVIQGLKPTPPFTHAI